MRYSFVLFQKGPIALQVISFRRSRYGQKVLYVSVPLSFCCDVILDSMQCHCSEGKAVIRNIWFLDLFSSLEKVVHYAFGKFLSLFLCCLMPHIVFDVVIVPGLICSHFALVLCLVYGALCYILCLFLIPSWRPRSHFRTKIWWQRVASEKVKVSNLTRMSKKREKLQKSKLSKKYPNYPKTFIMLNLAATAAARP